MKNVKKTNLGLILAEEGIVIVAGLYTVIVEFLLVSVSANVQTVLADMMEVDGETV